MNIGKLASFSLDSLRMMKAYVFGCQHDFEIRKTIILEWKILHAINQVSSTSTSDLQRNGLGNNNLSYL
jgi:hypothetical protein